MTTTPIDNVKKLKKRIARLTIVKDIFAGLADKRFLCDDFGSAEGKTCVIGALSKHYGCYDFVYALSGGNGIVDEFLDLCKEEKHLPVEDIADAYEVDLNQIEGLKVMKKAIGRKLLIELQAVNDAFEEDATGAVRKTRNKKRYAHVLQYVTEQLAEANQTVCGEQEHVGSGEV